jgi:hypothetical protein
MLMRTNSILCLGALALFVMEVAYSVEIRKYETQPISKAGPHPFFFCGPITATLKAILNLDAPVAPTSIRSI